jgi:hypothetical protein
MDLVTVTDHDSIGAAGALARHADFFISEEVTATMPSGTEAHVAVYGLNERQHQEVQRRRADIESLSNYLSGQRLAFGINHVFSGLTGRRFAADWAVFEREFPLVETLNGSIISAANRHAGRIASRWAKGATGGSDSHTVRGLGNAWTEVPDARDARGFLEGLRAGRGRVAGTSGGYWKLTMDVLDIIRSLFAESPRTRWLAPAVLALPIVTLVNWMSEAAFAGRWAIDVARMRPVIGVGVSNATEEAPA